MGLAEQARLVEVPGDLAEQLARDGPAAEVEPAHRQRRERDEAAAKAAAGPVAPVAQLA